MKQMGYLGVAAIFLSAWGTNGNTLTLADNGKTSYTVIYADQAAEPEKFAAKELTEHLKKVTGAEIPVVKESDFSMHGPAIYVGKTNYAVKQGITFEKLGNEEWIIRTVDSNLILTGGYPRGTVFAVYEFLENQVGCNWLDSKTTVIPSKNTLNIGNLNIQSKPWLWLRLIGGGGLMSPRRTADPKPYEIFAIRNKDQSYTNPDAGFYPITASIFGPHTFFKYVSPDLYKTHPEYFSQVDDGTRKPVQLCMTNPEIRKLMAENVKKAIRKDREDAQKKGWPYPVIYNIGHGDSRHCCMCPDCFAIAVSEETDSGPLLDFINAVADEIGKEYPDVRIMTMAYTFSLKPPKNMKARDNVMIWKINMLCRDILYPFSTQSSSWQSLLGWSKVSKHIMLFDYWWRSNNQYRLFPTPSTLVPSITAEFNMYADIPEIEAAFFETYEHVPGCEQNFTDLKYWLGFKLVQAPKQPIEPLIQTFMNGFYGAAAPKLKEYFDYLCSRQLDESVRGLTPNTMISSSYKLKYLDFDFYVKAERLFDEAEAAVKPDSLDLLHVQKERLILDGSLLFLWPWLEKKLPPGASMPFDREKIISRFESGWEKQFKTYFTDKQIETLSISWNSPKQKKWLVSVFRNLQLPEQFRNLPSRDVADFNCLAFSNVSPFEGPRLDWDNTAAGGLALMFTGKPEDHKDTLSFGVTGGPGVTLKADEIPQDAKYHLYKIGRVDVRKHMVAWGHGTRSLGVRLDWPGIGEGQEKDSNLWDAYISLKVDGPAYVKDSKSPNKVWMDRVILVRAPEAKARVATSSEKVQIRTPKIKEETAWPNPRFTVKDNCVADNLTGLTWTRNANPAGKKMGYDDAVKFCREFKLDGHTDWRLPKITEIQSLVTWRMWRPAIPNTVGTWRGLDGDPFLGVQLGFDVDYWARPTHAGFDDGAWEWDVSFDDNAGADDKYGEYYVWPVRGELQRMGD